MVVPRWYDGRAPVPCAADDCRRDPLVGSYGFRRRCNNAPMGYQFAHTETYARRISPLAGAGARTTRQIFAELAREPGHCEHVRMPLCPVVLHGMTPAQAEAEHDRLAAEARTPAGRRIRADTPTLYTEVHSLPRPPSELDRPEVQDWLRRITASRVAAVEARGGEVLAIYLHLDEARLHQHLIGVSRGDLQCRADLLHDGRRAQAEARARGEDRRGQTRAYCAAMRAWQDEVYQSVSAVCDFGLARIGPRRRRLTRAGWHAEQRALGAVSEGLRRAEAALAEVDRRCGAADVAQANAERLLTDVEQQRVLLGRIAGKLAAREAALVERENRLAACEAQVAEREVRLHRASELIPSVLCAVRRVLRDHLMGHPDEAVRRVARGLHDGMAAGLRAPGPEDAAAIIRTGWQVPRTERTLTMPP